MNWLKRTIDKVFGGGVTSKGSPRLGFTLAEVLITLGIIGVVAAMTIPGLITKFQKQITATQLKKAFSQLNQVMMRISDDYGMDVLAQKAQIVVPQYIQPYYPGSTYFPPESDYGKILCYNPEKNFIAGSNKKNQYASINKTTGASSGYISSPFHPGNTASILLQDGTCIGFSQLIGGTYVSANIFVDLNGSSTGPNRLGRDLFWFYLDQDKYTVLPVEKSLGYDFAALGVGAKIIKDAGWTIPKNYPWK